jgi:hypothetical protein
MDECAEDKNKTETRQPRVFPGLPAGAGKGGRLMGNGAFTPRYTVSSADGAYKFSFFCDLCGWHYATGWIAAADLGSAQTLAEKEARRYMSRCGKCGKWICDEHFNMSELMCVECAPLQNT